MLPGNMTDWHGEGACQYLEAYRSPTFTLG
jgi:hypothetical protein